MKKATRRIFKSKTTSQNLINELLQMMFLGALLVPAKDRAWLVSPWMSNVVLLDNSAGGFSSINPEWGNREIRLAEVLVELMVRGSPLGVATNLDEHNDALIEQLDNKSEELGLKDKLTMVRRPNLHIKGILFDRGLLTGSMNLTYYGLELNDEVVTYDTDRELLAQARTNFELYASPEQ